MTIRVFQILPLLLLATLLSGCGRHNHVGDEPHPLHERDNPRETPRTPHNRFIEKLTPEKEPTALERQISITFSGETLQQAVEKLAVLTEIGIIVTSSPGAGPPLDQRPIAFTARNVRMETILDWMARQADFFYTWDGRMLTISDNPERLIDPSLEQRVYPLLTMMRVQPTLSPVDFSAERAGIVRCVETLLAQYIEYQPEASIALSPSGEGFLAVCSPFAHRRINEILNEIGRSGPTPRPDFDDGLRRLEKKLETVVICNYVDVPLVNVLSLIGSQAGINIGFDPREIEGGVTRRINLDIGRASLKFALESIARQCGLTGHYLEADNNGVWLFAESQPIRHGQLIWKTGLIRSYDVRTIVDRMGISGLQTLVARNVTPGEWSAALPAMAYAATGRLVVFHTQQAHKEVASYLISLENLIRRGVTPELDD